MVSNSKDRWLLNGELIAIDHVLMEADLLHLRNFAKDQFIHLVTTVDLAVLFDGLLQILYNFISLIAWIQYFFIRR